MQRSIRKGVLYVVLSATLFAFSGAAAKSVSTDLAVGPMVLWRNAFSFVMTLGWMTARGFPNLRTGRLAAHIVRSTLSYGALLSYFVALRTLPLADAVLFQSSAPLFLPVLGYLLYRRVSDPQVWAGVLVGFAGVACIVRPGTVVMTTGTLSGLLSGLLGGAATTVMGAMSRTETAERQLFYFTLFSLLCSLMALPWTCKVPNSVDTLVLLVLSLLTTTGQFFFAKACVVAPPDKIMTWSYTAVILAVIIEHVGWHEETGLVTVAGMLLVIVGARWASHTRM